MKTISYCIIAFLMFMDNFSNAQKKPKNSMNHNFHLLIGTYTSGKSEGIYVYKFNVKSGEFSAESIAKNLKNPSYLVVSPDEKFVYSVGETDKNGDVYAFALDKKTGDLKQLNAQSANGDYPCFVDIDKTGKWVFVGNYGGGSLTVLPVEADGKIGKPSQTIQHVGKSINPTRQESPHVHSVNIAPNNVDVFVPDLGLDKIFTYSLDVKTGKLTAGNPPFTKVQEGAGPRHFTVHPNEKFAYVIQEISSDITTFNYKKGTLTAIQNISAKPEGFAGDFNCADIHLSPDGKFLYGSNRVHDSLVIYSVNPVTGKLTYIAHQSTMGKKPRNFLIDPTGSYVLVANQDSDTITIFKRDTKTGLLTSTGKEIAVPNPVCLKMISF